LTIAKISIKALGKVVVMEQYVDESIKWIIVGNDVVMSFYDTPDFECFVDFPETSEHPFMI